MKKPIAIGMSPNTRREDVLLAIRLLVSPSTYLTGTASKELEGWFERFFRGFHATSFINGRSGLYAILKVMGIGKGDEVILQGFTCIVVPNSITSRGATPIYVDITPSLTMNPKLLESAITERTKAIIVQHTFGIPADMDAIMKIAKKKKILVIEDVAHALGGEYRGKKLGSSGDASIFSFGRDKAFSATFGGMVITRDQKLHQELTAYQENLFNASKSWVAQQLVYPIATYVILSTYAVFSLGKVLHRLCVALHLLSLPVSFAERKAIFLASDVKKMPNALAKLALLQVSKVETYNQRREEIVLEYTKMARELSLETCPTSSDTLLRFPILVKNPKDMKAFFAKHQVYVGDWYTQPVDPRDVSLASAGYKKGSCPKTEKICSSIINLPTYPTMTNKDVEHILYLNKKYVQN